MRQVSAIDTLALRLETMVNRPPTIYENQEIPARKPFLVFEAIPVAPRVLGLKYQAEHSGTVQITVVTDDGQGTTEAEEVAQRVAALYPAGLVLDGVRIVMPPYLEKGYPDAGLWRQPLRIRWRVLPE